MSDTTASAIGSEPEPIEDAMASTTSGRMTAVRRSKASSLIPRNTDHVTPRSLHTAAERRASFGTPPAETFMECSTPLTLLYPLGRNGQ